MIDIIGAVLVLVVIQTMLPTAIQYFGAPGPLGSRLLAALGPRDQPPPMPATAGRAARALHNMMESLPIFIALALLAIVLDRDTGLAATGAMTFLAARVAYVPAYLSGIVGLRSLAWGAGASGLVMMAFSIFS